MSESPIHILAVVGALRQNSVTRTVVLHVAERLAAAGCVVDVLDLLPEPLPLFNPDEGHAFDAFPALKSRVERADVFLLGTPDYHGGISGALKNFLNHFWHEFTGKLFAPLVASHEKGLTATDQVRTVARQCYAWAMPYSVTFREGEDVGPTGITGAPFQKRLEMFVRDVRVYGSLLARQRRADLAGVEPGFLARLRR